MLTWKTERGSYLESQHWYRWFALSCVTLVFSMLVCEPSHAQLKPAIQKIDATQIVRKTGRRDANNFPYWVSHSDCTANDVMTFKVQITNPSVNQFEVWAGAQDCTQLANRQGNLAQCWQVYGNQVTKSPASIPIKVRDIVAQNGPKDGTNGNPGTGADCENRISLDIKLYFMYVNDGNEVSSNVITFDDIGIDMAGPIAPSIKRLLPSDDSLIAEWENTDTTMFAGYRVYCTDAVDTAATVDASASSTIEATSSTIEATSNGTDTASIDVLDAAIDAAQLDAVNDGGADAQVTTDGTTSAAAVAGCGGSDLQQGKYPSEDLRLCGTVDSYSARSGNAGGLRNGRSYAVGVTAIDRLGNESTLSNIECNVPREVYTFYEDYRSAGGDGGGGFCALGPVGQKRLAFPSLLLASIALVLACYRRNSQS